MPAGGGGGSGGSISLSLGELSGAGIDLSQWRQRRRPRRRRRRRTHRCDLSDQRLCRLVYRLRWRRCCVRRRRHHLYQARWLGVWATPRGQWRTIRHEHPPVRSPSIRALDLGPDRPTWGRRLPIGHILRMEQPLRRRCRNTVRPERPDQSRPHRLARCHR